jgi:lysine-N-methylase
MNWPIRHLPVLQNWDCHGCGECCREYQVTVTDAERERIESQGWQDDPRYAGVPLFIRGGTWRQPVHRLNVRPDNTCIFLDEEGRCRIHAKFGSEAKPLACRIYPFVLIPAGDHWRVGIRFACPSAANNLGRPMSASQEEMRGYARALESRESVAKRSPEPPPLHHRYRISWDDLERFNRAVLAIIDRPDSPIEYRLRMCVALDMLCRQAKFATVTGARLSEFLTVVTESLTSEIERDAEQIAPPGWIGRILFRQAAALYSRRDTGPRRGLSARGRLALLGAAWRFARGTGPLPRVHGLMPETTFAELELPAGPLPSASEMMLTRYYRVKCESMHFFGPTNFRLPYLDGLESLLLTFPATMWLSRAFSDQPREEAVTLALRIVDDNFGYNRLLGLSRQRFSTRLMTSRGELGRLIAWYSR